MEQNINIAALLKDCPKGTKLYSPWCGNCQFQFINPRGQIVVFADEMNDREIPITFEEKGNQFQSGECLLFPSKEVREWRYFNVKYVIAKQDNLQLLYENGGINDDVIDLGGIAFIENFTNKIKSMHRHCKIGKYILSTGTELKLEEEQPKFKVGDVVKANSDLLGNNILGVVKSMEHVGYKNDRYTLFVVDGGRSGSIDMPINDTDRLATPPEIAKWNKETLEPNHLHYSKSKRKIIDWFLPKDDVLVRDSDNCGYGGSSEWRLARFSHYSKTRAKGNFTQLYCADSVYWTECLPYNDKTAKLIGTTDDYKEQ